MTGDALQVQSQENPARRNGDLITGVLMRNLVAAGVVDMKSRQKIGWSGEPVCERGGREHLLYKAVIGHVQPQVHPNVVVEDIAALRTQFTAAASEQVRKPVGPAVDKRIFVRKSVSFRLNHQVDQLVSFFRGFIRN